MMMTQTTTDSLAPAEIEAAASRHIEALRTQLANLHARVTTAAEAAQTAEQDAHDAATRVQHLQEHLAALPKQIHEARAIALILSATAGAESARAKVAELEQLQQRAEAELPTAQQHAAHCAQVAADARAAQEAHLAEQERTQEEISGIVHALEAERMKAHRAAGEAILANLRGEIAERERAVRKAEEQLATAKAAEVVTRQSVRTRLLDAHPELSEQARTLLPDRATAAVGMLGGWLAHLESMEPYAGRDEVPTVDGVSVANLIGVLTPMHVLEVLTSPDGAVKLAGYIRGTKSRIEQARREAR